MIKIDRPTGLVRYDSFNGFAGKGRRYLRPRTYAYTALAALGIMALIFIASLKARPFNATISRIGGVGFYSDSSSVRNIYKIRVANKRNQSATVTIRLGADTPQGFELSGSNQTFTIGPLGEMSRTCVVLIPIDSYQGAADITLNIHADPGDVIIPKTIRFLGPNPQSTHP